jgi:putative acetyltransferase
MSPIIRLENRADQADIRELNQLAFGRDDEADLVDALRAGGHARVSLVADLAGQVVGHILFSELPILTRDGVVGALALAPLSVLPSQQRRGVGSRLVADGLQECKTAGHRIAIVLGHHEYYPRFGFSARLAERLVSPFSGPSFMALALVPGALEGITGEVRYPPPFTGL